LQRIDVNDLKIPKRLNTTVTAPWISLRYPFLNGAKLTANMVQFAHSGRIQTFRLKWIRTGYGLASPSSATASGQLSAFISTRAI